LFGIPLILTLLLKRMPSDNKSQSNRSSWPSFVKTSEGHRKV
jgi:hypothetical protein